jgi:shikimate kinase
MNPSVVDIVRPPARIVYLRVRPATALARLGAQRSSRPLLMRPDPLGELTRLLEERRAGYQAADVEISSELLPLQEVIDTVARLGEVA